MLPGSPTSSARTGFVIRDSAPGEPQSFPKNAEVSRFNTRYHAKNMNSVKSRPWLAYFMSMNVAFGFSFSVERFALLMTLNCTEKPPQTGNILARASTSVKRRRLTYGVYAHLDRTLRGLPTTLRWTT